MIFVKTGEEIELLRESSIVLQRSLFVTTVQSPDFWVTVVFRIRFVFL